MPWVLVEEMIIIRDDRSLNRRFRIDGFRV